MMEKYNIEFIERFKTSDIYPSKNSAPWGRFCLDFAGLNSGACSRVFDHDIMAARDNPTDLNDPRPVAVLIYPKTDWNHAFEDMTVNYFFKLGYKVLYYEANDENQAERALIEATSGGRKRANVILLGGHGTSRSLQHGRGHGEKYKIDTKDFRGNKPDINLPRYISPDGDLILESCSNGMGRSQNKTNLANTIAGYLPRGVTIHAATRPTSIYDITKDASGGLVVEYDGKRSTYTTTGTAENVVTESDLAVLEERHSQQVTALEYVIKDLMNRRSDKKEVSWLSETYDLVDTFNNLLNSRMNQHQHMAAKYELMRLAEKYNAEEQPSCGGANGGMRAIANL